MKKITISGVLFTMVLFLFGHSNLQAHGFLHKIPLKHQIEKSELVIEGKVLSKRSTWDDDRRLIYTINTVEVYKVFKGSPISIVDVITVGGVVGLEALMVHPSLTLQKGDVGVFTLTSNNVSISKTGKSKFKSFRPYGLSQGFYRYNLKEDIVANPFIKKSGIADGFYNEIRQHTKQRFVELKTFDVNQELAKRASSKTLLDPGAITLDKSTVTAGTKDVLTITGTSFGATKGKVWFRNADDGGATFISALDSQVTSWSDTEIVVEVPSLAGTGTILVEDSGGGQSPLSSTLTVSYSETNVQFDIDDDTESGGMNGPEPLIAYQVQHVDKNGSGGYTWEMHTDFFDETEPNPHGPGTITPGYKDAFMRAFDKWVCETGVNWNISGTATTVDIADGSDGTNVIRFDNGSELDPDVLGVCFSWYIGCSGSGSIDWFVNGLDIVFNNSVDNVSSPDITETWYSGTGVPSSSEYDFESVALHELGHGHQLAHVIDPVVDGNDLDDVMHWVLANGVSQKELTANNSTAANGIQSRSTSSAVCGESLMTDASCPLSVEELALDQAITIYPNPANGAFSIKNASLINIEKAVLYDVSGRLISTYNFTDVKKLKTVNVLKASKGLYFVKIHSENASITRKLILE